MFNVGDMVIANEKSDNCYLITNKRNQCVMIIKEVSSEDLVVVEVVHNKLSNRTRVSNSSLLFRKESV